MSSWLQTFGMVQVERMQRFLRTRNAPPHSTGENSSFTFYERRIIFMFFWEADAEVEEKRNNHLKNYTANVLFLNYEKPIQDIYKIK